MAEYYTYTLKIFEQAYNVNIINLKIKDIKITLCFWEMHHQVLYNNQ